jgi:hypothetical protein
MKTFRNISLILALVSVPAAFAQTFTLTPTTLSAAVAKTDGQVCVASTTGIVLPSIVAPGTILFADYEPMAVVAQGTSSSCYVVDRRFAPSAHVSGAIVYPGAPQLFSAADRAIGSACTAATELVLPIINTTNGKIFDCRSSGQIIQIGKGTMSAGSDETVRAFCTGTAGSAETEYLNGAACSGATTATARYVVAAPGTIANLRVTLSAAGAGGSNKDVITVTKNGSATALTVTTGTTACATAAAAACIDVAHSVAVAAGDVLQFQFVSATSDTAANVSASVEKF